MRLRSLLLPCSTATATTAAEPPGNLSLQSSLSDTSANSSSSSSSTPSSDTSYSSLQSNLSLQSLPSIPSLQKIPTAADSLNVAVSELHLASFKLPISHLAVHGAHLYVATTHEINVYDRTSFSHVTAFNARDSSSGSVKGIAFLNGEILTSHQDGKIRVWNLTNKSHFKLVNTLPTVNDRLHRFILPRNYVKVRRHKKVLWIQHADAVTGLAVHGDSVYSVSWDRSLKIWRGSDHRCVESVKAAHEDAVNAVAVSADGTVYTGSADRRIRVWSKPAGKKEKRHILMATLEKHKSAVNALALNSDGSLLFSGACDRSVLVWEREDSANYMTVIGALRGHRNSILCLIYVSDLLLSGSADRTVRVWQRGGDGRFSCLSVMEGHQKPVKSLVVVSEGVENGVVSVCSGSLDGELKAWKLSFSNHNSPLPNSNIMKWS